MSFYILRRPYSHLNNDFTYPPKGDFFIASCTSYFFLLCRKKYERSSAEGFLFLNTKRNINSGFVRNFDIVDYRDSYIVLFINGQFVPMR